MYNNILESLKTDLDEVYQLNEAKKGEPTRSLFGINFEEYSAYEELSHDMIYGKADPDRKWLAKMEKQIDKVKKNTRNWKKFKEAYERGAWEDYVYNVKIDDDGNWTSTRGKKDEKKMKWRKTLNKSSYKKRKKSGHMYEERDITPKK
jgi:hypothetical protein